MARNNRDDGILKWVTRPNTRNVTMFYVSNCPLPTRPSLQLTKFNGKRDCVPYSLVLFNGLYFHSVNLLKSTIDYEYTIN